MPRLRVAILFGGRSAEHEVSLRSARNVLLALDKEKFEPVLVGIDGEGRWHLASERWLLAATPLGRELPDGATSLAVEPGSPTLAHAEGKSFDRKRVDVVFPVLHGPMGEDGTVQGLLELLDLPYVGAGVLGSALGMDKDVMKRLLLAADIPVARFLAVRDFEFERDRSAVFDQADSLGYPLFTKPANLGSSVGIRRVAGRAELGAALDFAFRFDRKVMVEEDVEGREIECSVLGNDQPRASLPGEIVVRHPDGFYSYEAKYLDDQGAELRIPAELAPTEVSAVQALALRTFRALECRGLARVDFFLEPQGRILVNEINTLPGFTSSSMYPKLWEASGLGPCELVTELILLALEHKRRQRGLATCRA
jgi:D-alanine-D-alanine ligase